MRPWLLRLHRWTAFAFALPLLAVIASGLVLAVEPALKLAATPGTVTQEGLFAVLDKAGPAAERGGLTLRAWQGTVTLGGRGNARSFDLATAEPAQPSALPEMFITARRLHETLLLDLRWLVTASTFAMLALVAIGLLLGLPRLRNTLLGWHKVTGWALLPLLVGSPLTGLLMAYHIGVTPPAAAPAEDAVPVREVIRLVAQKHGLDGLEFIRQMRGGQRLVRVLVPGGSPVTYRVGPEGLQPQPNNWPRLLHEGYWAGMLGSAANLLVATAMLGLLGTGVVLWARRKYRQYQTRRRAMAMAA